MSTGKREEELARENGVALEVDAETPQASMETGSQERHSIVVPPKAREELKALLRLQNETQERVRLVLATLEEALEVPAGWVIRDVDEGFVELRAE